MDLFVNELPENCSQCEHCTKTHEGKFGIPFCNLARMPIYDGEDVKGRGHHTDSLSDFDCPLHSTSEIKKEQREYFINVLRKIKENLNRNIPYVSGYISGVLMRLTCEDKIND